MPVAAWARRSRRRTSAASRESSASAPCSVRRACYCRNRRSRSACSSTSFRPARPDVQKSFYSLLLERRLGEHALPAGTWVVAAGNRMQDRALVRSMSSALVNRVTILHVRVDVDEWQAWAQRHGVRADVRSVHPLPSRCACARRAAGAAAVLDAAGLGCFCRARWISRKVPACFRGKRGARSRSAGCRPRTPRCSARSRRSRSPRCGRWRTTSRIPRCCPQGEAARWFILDCIRRRVRDERLEGVSRKAVNRFLRSLPHEHQLNVLTDLVDRWGALGADTAMLALLKKVAATLSAGGPSQGALTLARVERVLRLVAVPFPHLAGLVAAARVSLDTRLPTMGVFASGRLAVNPAFVARLYRSRPAVRARPRDAASRACARTTARRERAGSSSTSRTTTSSTTCCAPSSAWSSIPANGLDMPGARDRSAEEIVLEMRRKGSGAAQRSRVWEGEPVSGQPRSPGGGSGEGTDDGGDVLADELERAWYPDEAAGQRSAVERMQALAARSLSLAEAMKAMRGARGSTRRRIAADRRRAARTLSDAMAARAPALDGVGRTRRAHVRPRGTTRGAPSRMSSCRDAGAKAGC